VSRAARARAGARQLARAGAFVGVNLAIIPPFVTRLRWTSRTGAEREALRDRWVRAWAGAQLRAFGIRVGVEGELPGAGGGRLLVANHRSAIDIGVLLHVAGGTMMARHDLADWPLVGPGARAADTLFVDRDQAQSGALALRALQRRLAEGSTVTVFPEGTTYDGDEVRPFHRGAFVSAALARAEILPVGLAYATGAPVAFVQPSFREHLAEVAGGPGFRVVAAVGEPLRAAAGERPAELAERARGVVQALVERAREAVDGDGRRPDSG